MLYFRQRRIRYGEMRRTTERKMAPSVSARVYIRKTKKTCEEATLPKEEGSQSDTRQTLTDG